MITKMSSPSTPKSITQRDSHDSHDSYDSELSPDEGSALPPSSQISLALRPSPHKRRDNRDDRSKENRHKNSLRRLELELELKKKELELDRLKGKEKERLKRRSQLEEDTSTDSERRRRRRRKSKSRSRSRHMSKAPVPPRCCDASISDNSLNNTDSESGPQTITPKVAEMIRQVTRAIPQAH
jgi:hypothetical protein